MEYPRNGTAALLKIAALLLFLLVTVYQIHGALVIKLEEQSDASLSYNTLVQITNVTSNQSTILRRIDLASRRSYLLHCEDEEKQVSLTAVWYSGDQEVQASSHSDPGRPLVYSFLEGNRQTLVLSNFTGGNVGVYRCRERGSSNTDGAGVVLGPSNPTVITAAQTKVLSYGQQEDNSRPSLIAFISGTPYPSSSDIVWHFNNQNLPSDVVVDGNELLLPSIVTSEMEGKYTCLVTTSAGSASDDIYVDLIYVPSVTITPSSPQTVKINSSITFSCEDSDGIPPPTFTWLHNGTSLRGDRISRTDETTASSYRSTLTIANFQSSDTGEYQCTATNEAGISHQTISINILQLSPPAPPTSILVTFISTCSILIQWVWPQVSSAPPDYIVIELNTVDEPHWWEVGHAGTTQTSLVTRVPVNSINTQFKLRAKCVSNSHGAGEYYTTTDVFTAYSSASLPVVLSPSTQVISSSAIQMSWNLPEQDCFNVTSITISCESATKDNITFRAQSTDVAESSTTVATVTGLEPDTIYNCSVSANLIERLNGEMSIQVKVYAPTLTTTYPKFGVFEFYLKGITSNCGQWIIESASAKKNDIATVIAEAIEKLCNCGFTTNNVQMRELRCSSSFPSVAVYQTELHDTPQSSLLELFSFLREWVSEEPSFVVQSQTIRVDSRCFSSDEEDCVTLGDSQSDMTFSSTYVIIGSAVGVALVLMISITITIVIIALLVVRHRKTAKLNSSSKEKRENGIPGTTNLTAVTEYIIESAEYPYYEQVQDFDGEPQYESLDEYDKLSRIDKISQEKMADCPVYEPTAGSHT